MYRTLFTLILTACAGSTQAPPAPSAPAPTSAPAAPAGTAAADVPVGPDGPADLAIPEFQVDPSLVDQGKGVFDAKGCGGCHQFGAKLVGPDLNGVGERRSQKWIAKMVKHPSDMVKRDPTAKGLYRELMVEMTDQGVADDEVGPLISFLVSHPATK